MKSWVGTSIRTVIGLAALTLAAQTWAGTEWVRGTVVKLDAERNRVTLKHERIRSIQMAAMTMPFKVADGVQLAPLKVGDTVRFSVAMQNDDLLVTRIEVAK
jgi:Cu/Ag efflux protein CusF